MAKFCPNCGKELEENADLCLNCGKLVKNKSEEKVKAKKIPGWAIALIVCGCLIPIILFIVAIVFIFLSYEPTPLGGGIGDTLSGSGLALTLDDAIIYDYIGEDENLLDIPAPGKEYLVFFLKIKNIDYEERDIDNYDFYGSIDGDIIQKPVVLMNEVNNLKPFFGTIPKSMTMKGYVAFEIDTTWDSFNLYYEDDDYDEKMFFQVTNPHTDEPDDENAIDNNSNI